ncbi:hypothetical protein J2X20_005476 [Pelomonas saccharophila]|uniref:Fibronectin type-III domain-containing protein n=1 Tax=Roseateles saccharophilus TaxID=304 RepID=A0ABU1YVB1_ROSSA|nr:hypothetical protein [Roseateles saccharophilus]MDR7272793.1 hypothetical protein [Roseateles saccharophilus]
MTASLRLLAPLCAGLLLLAGCGGGGDSAAPAVPPSPSTPIPTPTPPAPAATMTAVSGSAMHATVSWSGGSPGTRWRLERRSGDGGAFAAVAEVDSDAGLWLDSGLSADTGYAYRLVRTDGSVAASASARTGSEAVLTTAAPQPVGDGTPLPFTPATRRLSAADGSLQLELPDGSFSQAGTALLRPTGNPLPDGVGPGLSLSLPERPARTLTLSLRYGADENADDVTQDRIALRQVDGSWWVLPLAAHDEAQHLLQVSLPPGLWPAQPTASTLQAKPAAASSVLKADFVRVKAHKLLPAAATVRVLGSQRFMPVSIYAMRDIACASGDPDDLCIPMPVLRDVTVPVLNAKPGFQRQWTLEGSDAPAASLGTLAVEPQAGVVYTAPAQVPATNPLTLRFRSVHGASGRRLLLTARIRVTEDAWVGSLKGVVGDLLTGHEFKLATRWTLDAAQSTDTLRVYRPSGDAEHVYTMLDPVCTHTVSPTRLSLAQADTTGQLVVDESTRPARYTLALSTRWNSVLTVNCPRGSTTAPFFGGHVWSAQGVVTGGQIQGSDSGLGERSWSLGRPQ